MTMKWATVTAVAPLRVTLDGDTGALPYAPESLVDPAYLQVNDRVRCELSDRRVVIVGRSGGDGFTVPDASATVKGVAEFATNEETITGTDATRVVTPAGLKARLASSFVPYRMSASSVNFGPGPLASPGFVSVTVTFASGRFTQTPIITLGTNSARLGPQADARSATSFRFGIGNFSGADAGPGSGDDVLIGFWHAIQMTEGSGAG